MPISTARTGALTFGALLFVGVSACSAQPEKVPGDADGRRPAGGEQHGLQLISRAARR